MPQRKKKCTDVYRKTFANFICKTSKLNWSFCQPQTPMKLQLQFDFQYWVSTESENFNFRRSADFSMLFSFVMLVNYWKKEMMLASFFEWRKKNLRLDRSARGLKKNNSTFLSSHYRRTSAKSCVQYQRLKGCIWYFGKRHNICTEYRYSIYMF